MPAELSGLSQDRRHENFQMTNPTSKQRLSDAELADLIRLVVPCRSRDAFIELQERRAVETTGWLGVEKLAEQRNAAYRALESIKRHATPPHADLRGVCEGIVRLVDKALGSSSVEPTPRQSVSEFIQEVRDNPEWPAVKATGRPLTESERDAMGRALERSQTVVDDGSVKASEDLVPRDSQGHAIGHPKDCRINNGMDMTCNCGAESESAP
jgi:hypothetical protein